jgi:hypothetical protein
MRHNEHLGSVRTGQVYDEPEDKGVIDVLGAWDGYHYTALRINKDGETDLPAQR